MAKIRQYIGARYVPKFYENSDGNSEWKSGVAYEPLTIVTWNGNSYTSKKSVPSSVGNPSENTSYWVSTGIFNEQLDEIINSLEDLQADVNDGKRYVMQISMEPTAQPTGECYAFIYNKSAFLVDLGLYAQFTRVRDSLYAVGVERIEGIFITHYHGDHDGNPYVDNSDPYVHWKNSFDMTGCVFYLPLNPPAGVSAWEQTSEERLRRSFPDNEFYKPPYSAITWHGISFETFNNTQSDYDYYINNNVTDYNQYSQIVRAEFENNSILILGDCGEPAQSYQYSLGKFKPTTAICTGHHGLEGAASAGMIARVSAKYALCSNSYNANEYMRDPVLIETHKRGGVVMTAVNNYPQNVIGDFGRGAFLSGCCDSFSTYAGYGHRTIYFDPTYSAGSYQDGTETHPFSSMRRVIGACKGGYNTVVLQGDVTEATGTIQITADNGFIEFLGGGHSASTVAIFMKDGANAIFNSFNGIGVLQVQECSTVRVVACGTIGNLIVQESTGFGSSFSVTQGSYRNALCAFNNQVYTGTGSFTP